MGLYFIAAGQSSKNREKSLDKGFRLDQIAEYLDAEKVDQLKSCFGATDEIFLWGANNTRELSSVKKGDYVVDVKNKEVVQVFEFCFYVETRNINLQQFVGWDSEKPQHEQRQYKYVYFLKSPRQVKNNDKNYYQSAFDLQDNPQWLVGQKWFDDVAIENALKNTGHDSLDTFLGIDLQTKNARVSGNRDEIKKGGVLLSLFLFFVVTMVIIGAIIFIKD